MGEVTTPQKLSKLKMKAFATALFAVAAVKAEADPQFLAYNNVVASPLLRSIVHTPAVYTHAINPAVTYTAPVVTKAVVAPRFHAESAGGVKHTVLKREADPALLYTNAWGMSPYMYGARPLAYARNLNTQPPSIQC